MRLFIAFNALVYLAFGPAFYFFPQALAGLLGITLGSPTALADFRAMYGGLPLAAGLLMAIASKRASWQEPAYFLCMAGAAGLLFGRVLSIVLCGAPGLPIYGFMASEIVALVWGAILYRQRARLA